MQKRYSCPDRSLLQLFIFKSLTHKLTIQSKTKLTLVHIETNTEDSFLFETFSERDSKSVRGMSELAETVVGETEIVIGKGRVHVESLLASDSYF